MPAPSIDFFFTMGSTYTYLAVMRLPEIERASGIAFRWRPFHLLTILNDMKHVPFADKPAKMTYMWRDIERRAAMHGMPIKVPAPTRRSSRCSPTRSRCSACRKAGARHSCAKPIANGSSSGTRPAASRT